MEAVDEEDSVFSSPINPSEPDGKSINMLGRKTFVIKKHIRIRWFKIIYTSNEFTGTKSVDYQETGYGSDEDKMSIKSDKENFNPNPYMKEKIKRGRDFVKPKVSKIKQPNKPDSQPNSRNGSRSGSKTRREIRS